MSGDQSNRALANYCASFIDLLGQRDAMKDQGLLPQFKSEEEETDFFNRYRLSVGAIDRLQKVVATFMEPHPEFSLRERLDSDEAKQAYDRTRELKMKQQRWSDGLVLYTVMAGAAPMNAIFEIICTSGALCLLGLADGSPVRGGIDIAWGVELHDNELYGPVVASTYDLESRVAQYPRIVLGDRVVHYMETAARHVSADPIDQVNSAYAQLCLQMTAADLDGMHIIDYLGTTFEGAVVQDAGKDIYNSARAYCQKQLSAHASSRNTKLTVRYKWLMDYFDMARPSPPSGGPDVV